jgi:hypothetical protein
MNTYLIDHPRIAGGVPNDGDLSYLERIEDSPRPWGKSLANGEISVLGDIRGWLSSCSCPIGRLPNAGTRPPTFPMILSLRANDAIVHDIGGPSAWNGLSSIPVVCAASAARRTCLFPDNSAWLVCDVRGRARVKMNQLPEDASSSAASRDKPLRAEGVNRDRA